MVINGYLRLAFELKTHFLYALREGHPALVRHGVEHQYTARLHHLTQTLHHLAQPTAMSADERGLWSRVLGKVGLQKIADDRDDTRRAEPASVLLHQLATLLAHLESRHMKMRKLEFCLDAHAARTEADIPERMSPPQVEQ